MFDSFKNTGNIKAVFCGHDHDNDFHGTYESIELFYGRKTGIASSGELPRGGRVIRLTEFMNKEGDSDFNYESWIVLPNGTII